MTDWLYPMAPSIQPSGDRNGSSSIGNPPEATAGGNPAELKQACSQMESLFINYLFKAMRATVPESGLLGDGRTEKIYTGMLDERVARNLASGRGIGLAGILNRQLRREPTDVSVIGNEPEAGRTPLRMSGGDGPEALTPEEKKEGISKDLGKSADIAVNGRLSTVPAPGPSRRHLNTTLSRES